MATVIYDHEWGARSTKVFGCSFKSITAQMGFNSQPIVFTVTVVEENNQDFTLDMTAIRSVQHISFGELDLLGIVQSWERTTVDVNGTGIYTIKLTDCRTVLDSANITNVYVNDPESEVALIDANIVYVATTGDEVDEDSSSKEEDCGVMFSTVIDRVEAATLTYGSEVFEVDMTELRDLTNWRGDGIEQYYIEGEIRSLVSIITEFCGAVGAEWWVEAHRKSVTDQTIVITIKVIRRLDGIGNPIAIDMDALAALHDNEVIRRVDGFENNDITTHKVIWGGVKRKLCAFTDISIHQFWGLDVNGQPLAQPSYVMPNDPQYRRVSTTTEQLTDVVNGAIADDMDQDQLAALKRYVDDFWGKRFYISLDKNTLSDSSLSMPTYPEIIPAAWWEGDTPPHGAQQFDPDVLMKMTTEDGRWGPFVSLPSIFVTGSGTEESPIKPHYITWAPLSANSTNTIWREGEAYMRCVLEQYGRYVVIVLPVPLTRYYIDPDTGVIDSDTLVRHESLSMAWIPLMDRGIHYGPWSNTSLVKSRVPSPGRSEVIVDKDLVPWIFGDRNMFHSTAMDMLTDLAGKKIDTLPAMPVINTGQLEVVGTPKVNIGQAVGLGGSITEVFVRFDDNGVTTRYGMNLYTRELGEFKRKRQQERETDQAEAEKEPDDEFPEVKDDLQAPPSPEAAPEQEDLQGPTDILWDVTMDKPEGGMGVIQAVEGGGPYYTVRRLNYRDIDAAGSVTDPLLLRAFVPEWTHVRNLAEPFNSPGWLPIGTRVTVSIYSEGPLGPFVEYIEQTPPTFAPPLP